jgi:Zn-dependent protease with chaperone function
MKLVRVILEGQLYLAGILAIFVAELAVLFWGLWSRRPIVGLVAVFVAVPLIRSTVSAIRACFLRIRAPEGLFLDRSEGRALYAFADEIRRTVDAPHVDSITITAGFNAAAAAYRPSWRLRRRRVLVLGLPVLTTLSVEELRAVIAHELAHFSSAHDPFAAWVYRTRTSWFELRAALDQRLATPVYVYWLLHWYVPRLNAASAEVGRRHELVADRVAAEVAGARATADALLVVETATRFADDAYWPAIRTSHQTVAEPPRPFAGMLTWKARTTSATTLDALLAPDTTLDDTHPSLRERIDRLGESIRLPRAVARSAGEELLAPTLATLAARFDEEWLSRHGDGWHRLRAEYLERRAALDRLTAIETPTTDEMFERAVLIEALNGSDDALAIYQSAAEKGHPAASLAAGRMLLDRLDAKGIALVERSMDQDDSLVPEGCRILAAYYTDTGQALAARKCEWRATRQATRAHLSASAPGARDP